ncbi:MAG: hypothetical protein K6B73_04615 [Treponema sp.]|nr:hypothetical protein [Treponema sp.]
MKSSRFNFGRALLTLCAIFFVSFSFISCQQETETKTEYVSDYVYEYVIVNPYTDSEDYDKLNGNVWASTGGDAYTFSNANVTYFDGGWGYDWTGKVAGIYGNYIYFKYVTVGSGLDSSLVGKYNAINFKNLTSSSVSMGTASNYTNKRKAYTDTLEEAVKEFTLDNGYWTYWGEYTVNNQ